MVRTYQKRKVPCRYCANRIEVSRYSFEELRYTSGVCDECQERLRHAQECETCHIKLFQGCDECKFLGTHYDSKKLYHKTIPDSYKDEHVCQHHWNEYMRKIKAIVGYYDE